MASATVPLAHPPIGHAGWSSESSTLAPAAFRDRSGSVRIENHVRLCVPSLAEMAGQSCAPDHRSSFADHRMSWQPPSPHVLPIRTIVRVVLAIGAVWLLLELRHVLLLIAVAFLIAAALAPPV